MLTLQVSGAHSENDRVKVSKHKLLQDPANILSVNSLISSGGKKKRFKILTYGYIDGNGIIIKSTIICLSGL